MIIELKAAAVAELNNVMLLEIAGFLCNPEMQERYTLSKLDFTLSWQKSVLNLEPTLSAFVHQGFAALVFSVLPDFR